jgi:hypothetical protein
LPPTKVQAAWVVEKSAAIIISAILWELPVRFLIEFLLHLGTFPTRFLPYSHFFATPLLILHLIGSKFDFFAHYAIIRPIMNSRLYTAMNFSPRRAGISHAKVAVLPRMRSARLRCFLEE